jgi:excisionase family DNA binding protein
MAGMFYSLKETADRLGKTEDDVRQLARAGKLREFRDGSHVLFKMDEVNALLAEGIEIDLEAEPAVAGEPIEVVDAEPAATPEGPSEDDVLDLLEEAAPAVEPPGEIEASSEVELAAEPEAEASSEMELAAEPEGEASSEMDLAAEPEGEASSEMDLAAEPEAEASSEFDLAAESGGEGTTTTDDELFFLDEDEKPAVESGAEKAAETDDEIALAPETGASGSESDITDMDTALTGEGVNVLSETDTGYDVMDDSVADTAAPGASAEKTGTGTGSDAEASLEEIEDDVNLDSFGSGSGLLDLSLQADDTSLGGILDEIYTAEGGEEAPAAAAEPGSVEDMTAEAEQVVPDEEVAAPEAAAAQPVAAAYPTYAEAAPDTQSNILGMLLLLPLLALLYTAIVAISGQRGVMPGIVSAIRGLIWPLVGGLIVVALLISGASFVMGGEKAPKAAAAKKVKAAKPDKSKKEKAPKMEKPGEKPAKEKKGFSLFGKKKGKK